MSKDKVISLENPEWNADVLTDFLRKQSGKSSAKTRSQRCWVQKTANIPNKLSKYSQAKEK
tara:strand:+ start:326 stop:508 length:183 start_codon:yes stop_codon:yes gene_type:complete